jgi:hypothetical protein
MLQVVPSELWSDSLVSVGGRHDLATSDRFCQWAESRVG